jgi:glycosyltransferase involved in cell wall biosynthesis
MEIEMVSIIIPCYNYGKLLPDTLENVLQQTYSNWECIVIDDGSTDNTRQVVENFIKKDKRFTYIYQVNSGVSLARNNGLRYAKGHYIQFIDADDLLATRKLELHVDYLMHNPSVDLVYGPVRYFDDGNFGSLRESFDMSLKPWMPNISGQGYDIIFELVKWNIMVIHSPLVKKVAVEKAGLFYGSLRYNEDWYLWLKCALLGVNIIYDNRMDGVAYVRVHKTSASQDRTKMIVGERDMRLLIKPDLKFPEYNRIAAFNQGRINELNHALGCLYFENKKYIEGINSFFNSARETGEYINNMKHVLHHLKVVVYKAF